MDINFGNAFYILGEEEENSVTGRKRFFGHRRRMHFAMLSIMYKMGVMTTLLVALAVLALKSLTIGVILLIFAFGEWDLTI